MNNTNLCATLEVVFELALKADFQCQSVCQSTTLVQPEVTQQIFDKWR